MTQSVFEQSLKLQASTLQSAMEKMGFQTSHQQSLELLSIANGFENGWSQLRTMFDPKTSVNYVSAPALAEHAQDFISNFCDPVDFAQESEVVVTTGGVCAVVERHDDGELAGVTLTNLAGVELMKYEATEFEDAPLEVTGAILNMLTTKATPSRGAIPIGGGASQVVIDPAFHHLPIGGKFEPLSKQSLKRMKSQAGDSGYFSFLMMVSPFDIADIDALNEMVDETLEDNGVVLANIDDDMDEDEKPSGVSAIDISYNVVGYAREEGYIAGKTILKVTFSIDTY